MQKVSSSYSPLKRAALRRTTWREKLGVGSTCKVGRIKRHLKRGRIPSPRVLRTHTSGGFYGKKRPLVFISSVKRRIQVYTDTCHRAEISMVTGMVNIRKK